MDGGRVPCEGDACLQRAARTFTYSPDRGATPPAGFYLARFGSVRLALSARARSARSCIETFAGLRATKLSTYVQSSLHGGNPKPCRVRVDLAEWLSSTAGSSEYCVAGLAGRLHTVQYTRTSPCTDVDSSFACAELAAARLARVPPAAAAAAAAVGSGRWAQL